MNQTIQAFGYPATVITEYTYWIVLLRPQQITLGTLVIAAKSEVLNLGQLSTEVWAEFAIVTNEIEKLLTQVFGAEKFNYLALMMKDPNVHFHFIPRYSKAITLAGKEYIDHDWPTKTEMKSLDLSDKEFSLIKECLTS